LRPYSTATSYKQYYYNIIVITTAITWRYGDGAVNTVEENSSVFSLIRMC